MNGLLDRFMAKVSVNADTGCWEWTGAITKASMSEGGGYGRFKLPAWSNTGWAHRAAHELFKGPVPTGMELDHTCRVRHCVNLEHLEVVTKAENAIRREAAKREGWDYPHPSRGTCAPGCRDYGTCHCGSCAMPTAISPQTVTERCIIRGRPRVFIAGHARKATRYECRGPLTRSGIPVARVEQLVLFLHDEYGSWKAAAEVVGVPESTLRMTVRRNRHASRRVALCVVEAVKAHEAALRREAANPATMERRHHRGNHVEERDLDCHLCAKAAVSR